MVDLMVNSMVIYNISKKTYNRLVKQKNSKIIARKYRIGVKKDKISQEQKLEIPRMLDDIFPVQSKRKYKYQKTTE
jgi:hypothetical protein